MDDHDICVEAAKVYIRQAAGNVYVYVKGDNGITSCYSIVGDVRVCRGTVNVTSRIDLIEHGTVFPGDE